MPTQRLEDAQLFATQIQMGSYAVTLPSVQQMNSGTAGAGMEWPAEAIVNLRQLGKGVSWALAIEGAAALSLYAVWHLWL